MRVLDVGCSTGRGGATLNRLRPDIELWALDCIPERLDQIDQRVYSRAICAPSMSLPLADGSVDAIVAGEFVEHLTVEDALLTIREFHRVLRGGGQILMTTPNPSYARLLLSGLTVVGGAHLSEWTPGLMAALLESLGFRPDFVEGTGRVSVVLGRRMPGWVYGSYMLGASRC
jgi:SAM-dependent methyltransferase